MKEETLKAIQEIIDHKRAMLKPREIKCFSSDTRYLISMTGLSHTE